MFTESSSSSWKCRWDWLLSWRGHFLNVADSQRSTFLLWTFPLLLDHFYFCCKSLMPYGLFTGTFQQRGSWNIPQIIRTQAGCHLPHNVNESEELEVAEMRQRGPFLTCKCSPFKCFFSTFFLLWLCENPQLSQLFMFFPGRKSDDSIFLVKESTSNSSTIIRIFLGEGLFSF